MQSDNLSRRKDIAKAKICIHGDASTVHLMRWSRALKCLGYNVTVISYRKAEIPDVEIHDISCSELRGSSKFEGMIKILRGIKMFCRLRQALARIKPDIVHVHYLMNTPLVLGFWGIRNLVVSPWGNDIIYDRGREPLVVSIYKKLLLRWAKEITATTSFLASHVERYANRSPEVIAFGVETEIFRRRKSVKQKCVVISFIKHLKEKYGPRFLLQAVPLMLDKTENIIVNIVGTGPQEKYLRELTKQLRIQRYVKFLGGIPHERVVEVLEETDIFVMPSIYESEVFGVAAIEASAMEVPVIASDLGGIREAVVDGVTGILTPPGDERAIADACLSLIIDQSLRRKMGKRGRKFVTSRYEWSQCVERMIAVYRRVLEK